MSWSDLTEVEWHILNPLLPERGECGPPIPDKRRTDNGILWVLRTGAPWRDMPERYGNWNSGPRSSKLARGTKLMLVSVCICTYKRLTVTDTIGSIFLQEGISLSEVEIIVCDDDPAASAKEIVVNLASHAPISVRYVFSGARNIAACRNRCLLDARGDWIAFIDDDETAEPGWLAELLLAQTQHAADVVKSYVRGIYPRQTPSWILAGEPFTRDYGTTGTVLAVVPTCGVLFRRALTLRNHIEFDLTFGQTGGEDVDFFHRLGRSGAKMVFCRSAVVNEIVPLARVSVAYLAYRARRGGHINGRAFFAYQSPAHRLFTVAKSVVGILLGAPYQVAVFVRAAPAYRMLVMFWYHLGVLEWAAGCAAPTLE